MRKWLPLLLLAVLTACGFQLRGNYPLPFETIHIALPDTSPVYNLLKRNIESGSKTRVVDDPAQAQAIMTVTDDRSTKTILSLSAAGRVREFQLIRQFVFRVHTPDGRDYIPYSEIILRRDLPYSDTSTLSKEAEEQLLQKNIQEDLIQQLMRRLAAAKLNAPAPDAAAR